MFFEQTTEQMAEEIHTLALHEHRCKVLTELLEDEHNELEISDYFHKASLATIERLSDVIAHRINYLEEQTEQARNQAFDKFRKRKL